jgi:hypothetical protein
LHPIPDGWNTGRCCYSDRRIICCPCQRIQSLGHHSGCVRYKALELVKLQESGYRYPLPLLTGQRVGMTAYPFGYLYPASRLFFWEREEKQVEHGRFDPLFMNLWDVSRTLGLESLFLK